MPGAGPDGPRDRALAEHPPGGRILLEAQRMGAPGQDIAHVIVAGLGDLFGGRFLRRRLRPGPQAGRAKRQTEDNSGYGSQDGPLLPGHVP
jgi:hypothetical protein